MNGRLCSNFNTKLVFSTTWNQEDDQLSVDHDCFQLEMHINIRRQNKQRPAGKKY
jgi:hypothetical protein